MNNTFAQRVFAVLALVLIAVCVILSPTVTTLSKQQNEPYNPGSVYHAQLEEEDYRIPFSAIERQDPKLPKGTRVVVQHGELGTGRQTFVSITKDGQYYNKVVLRREIVNPSKPRIIRVGTGRDRKTQVALEKRRTISRGVAGKTLTVVATAYTHTGNRTATGTWPKVGTIAVDPKVIPLGTKLYVEGYGLAIAADTGGAIKGAKIDIFLDTRDECLNWGRRQVSVTILP